MQMPSMPMRQATPQEKARDAYNDGVRYVKKADKARHAANDASDPGKKDKASKEAHDAYAAALAKFCESTGHEPDGRVLRAALRAWQPRRGQNGDSPGWTYLRAAEEQRGIALDAASRYA
jgi:hypothetical protein